MRQANRQARWGRHGAAGCGASRGFSLLELAVAVIVVAFAAMILLERLAYYEEVAEKAKMEATVSSIKSALRVRMAALMIAGRVQDYPAMAVQNPFDWLGRKPDDYRGAAPATGMAHGSEPGWYVDTSDHTLLYLPHNARHLQPDSQGIKRIRLRVAVSQERLASDPSAATTDTTASVSLRLVEPYRWFAGSGRSGQ